MWLGHVICERCLLVQRDVIAKCPPELFTVEECGYAVGCARCGCWYARYVLI